MPCEWGLTDVGSWPRLRSMTVTEAATALGLSVKTLRQQIKNRKLRASKMGRNWYLSPDEVERYRVEHKRTAA